MSQANAQAGGVNVLALHGLAASAAVWRPITEEAPPWMRFEALDLPGHGRAPETARELTLDAMAKVCVSASPAPAIWLGWSLGGLVALRAARRFPQSVLGVVAVAISPRFLVAADWQNAIALEEFVSFKRGLKQEGTKALHRFFALQTHTRHGVSAKLTGKLRALALADGAPRPEVLENTLSILGTSDLREEAAALSCPVMTVLGEDDVLVPSAVSEDLCRLNPVWRVEVMAAAGHVPFLSHPKAFLLLLDSFVRTVSGVLHDQ